MDKKNITEVFFKKSPGFPIEIITPCGKITEMNKH